MGLSFYSKSLLISKKTKMDSNIILGIAITIAVIIPVVILATSGKRKQKRSIEKFRKFATSNGLEISEFDCCDLGIIGIDSKAKKLAYQAKSDDGIIIDLHDVKSCNSRTSSENTQGEIIDKLVIDIEFKEGKGTKILPLFSSENKLALDAEKAITEKWNKTIETNLA